MDDNTDSLHKHLYSSKMWQSRAFASSHFTTSSMDQEFATKSSVWKFEVDMEFTISQINKRWLYSMKSV